MCLRNDDIAVQDSLYTIGRRGVAGTIFVHKIAGAAAEAGKKLDEVKRIAEKRSRTLRRLVSRSAPVRFLQKERQLLQSKTGEMEFGVGIHGEPGIERCAAEPSAKTAKRMCDMLVSELALKSADERALLINGLGGTPLMELYILEQGYL